MMMDYNATNRETHCIDAEEAELRNFGSDHAVVSRYADGLELESSSADMPPIKHLNIRPHIRAKSILVGDLFPTRRGSCISSLVSSVTLTNFDGSFLTDDDGSQEWGCSDLTFKEDEDDVYRSIDTACLHADSDHRPIRPMRQGSLRMEKISSTRRPELRDAKGHSHSNDHVHDDPTEEGSGHVYLVRKSNCELPPVKPGRQDSISTIGVPVRKHRFDSKPTIPDRHASVATFVAEDLPGIEKSTDEETTTSSTHSPYLHKSEGKRSLLLETQASGPVV
jgi:hypothetical protein